MHPLSIQKAESMSYIGVLLHMNFTLFGKKIIEHFFIHTCNSTIASNNKDKSTKILALIYRAKLKGAHERFKSLKG